MNAQIGVPAGKQDITPQVWFDVRLTDQGTCLSLCDERVNRRYTIIFDENGNIDRREVAAMSPEQSEVEPGEARPQTIRPSEVDECMRAMRRARVRPAARFKASRKHAFILRYRRTARPRNQCYPLAGYANSTITFVMYRVPSSSRHEALAKLVSETEMIINDDHDEDRLPKDQWERLLELPLGTTFKLNGQTWTKLDVVEVGPLVAGKTFYCRRVDQF